MTPRTLIGHLARHAHTTPDRLAVGSVASALTYGVLWERVLFAAHVLRTAGVGAGDRVALAAPRDPEFLYGYFACHALGAIAVPHEPDIVATKLQQIVELVGARLALTSRAAPSLPCPTLGLATLAHGGEVSQAAAFVEPDPERPADVLLTSGTTGTPKGVRLTQRNILAAARNINQFIGNTAEDREALALPLSHSFGLGRARCQILAGGALILTPGFQFPKQLFEAMRHWRASGVSFVPAAWTLLTRLSGERIAEFAPALRYVEIGSAAMPRSEKERLLRLFPKTRICMHYGLTEASRSAFIEFHDAQDRLDSIGRPSPNVDIRVVDEDDRELAPRAVGRIRIRGEHVAGGYWNAEAGDRLRGGWLYSGDLGYRDEDGYLYLSGREDDVINVGGRKVHPTEVEQALVRHELIADAACVGTTDALTGEGVRALLVARQGTSPASLPSRETLIEFLRQTLEPYKVPSSFEWVSTIPRNASGKVERRTIAGAPPPLAGARG
jgi:long-chain acyl-CoA synthetase